PPSPASARTWRPCSRTRTSRRRLGPHQPDGQACMPPSSSRRRGIIMYPNSALSAGQLAIMAVVAVVSLAAWLILVALAARQPRGKSAAANAGPREEETAATVTQLPSGARPADKTAALSV